MPILDDFKLKVGQTFWRIEFIENTTIYKVNTIVLKKIHPPFLDFSSRITLTIEEFNSSYSLSKYDAWVAAWIYYSKIKILMTNRSILANRIVKDYSMNPLIKEKMIVIKTVYVDMDGVLVDFVGGVGKLYGIKDLTLEWSTYEKSLGLSPKTWDVAKILDTSTEELWKKIDSEGSAFWENLHDYSWAFSIYKSIEQILNIKPIILTSPSISSSCINGKIKWLKKFFGKSFRNYIFCPAEHKHLLANSSTLLIDDSIKNCNKFHEAKGNVIVFPMPWNSSNEKLIELDRVKYLQKLLQMNT